MKTRLVWLAGIGLLIAGCGAEPLDDTAVAQDELIRPPVRPIGLKPDLTLLAAPFPGSNDVQPCSEVRVRVNYTPPLVSLPIAAEAVPAASLVPVQVSLVGFNDHNQSLPPLFATVQLSPRGGSALADFQLPFGYGERVLFTVDPNNRIAESNEANNSLFYSWGCLF
jgi:hypothetical protein